MTGMESQQVSCSDENALFMRVENSPGVRVITGVGGDGRLATGLGLTPEGYAIYVDGERIEGGFLGLGGIVRWGFKERDEEGVWDARLMVPSAEDEEGEVYGFLEARSPGGGLNRGSSLGIAGL